MVLLAKSRPGGALGRVWDTPDAVVEVTDSEAQQLLAIGHADFYLPKDAPARQDDAPADEVSDEGDATEDAAPKRTRKPRSDAPSES